MLNKVKNIVTSINITVAGIILFLYGILRFKKVFLRDFANGDENSFNKILQLYLDKGYNETLNEGSSIFFNLISSFFYLFTSNSLYSIRLTSIFFGILTLFTVIKIQKSFFKLPKGYSVIFLYTVLNILIVSSIIFSGINDSILYFFSSLFVFFCLQFNRDKKVIKFSIASGIIIGLMFLTRKMAIIYMPPVFLVLLILFYKLDLKYFIRFKVLTIITIIPILLICILNLPNLIESKGISFHEKKLDNEISWPQLQYLTALKNSEGKVKHGQHVSIQEVKDYLILNGKESLPGDTFISSALFNIPFTIKQFFKNIGLQIVPITRLTGLMFLFFIIALFSKNRIYFLKKHSLIVIFFNVFVVSLCLIVINYIEPRWYIGLLVLFTIPAYSIMEEFVSHKKKKEFINLIIVNSQLLSIILINLPYIVSNYKDLM